MVTYLGSLVQLCCGERGTLQTKIPLACVGSARTIWTTLGLPQLTAVCAFRVYGSGSRVSAGVLSKADPVFMHFQGLSFSGSGSWVLLKGTDSTGMCFVCFLGLSSSGDQVLGEYTVPCGPCVLITSPSQQLGFLGAQREHRLR